MDASEEEEEGYGGGEVAGGEAGNGEGLGNEEANAGASGGRMEEEEEEEEGGTALAPNGTYEEDEEYLVGLMGGMTTATPHVSSLLPLVEGGEAEEEGEYEMSSIMEGDDSEEGMMGQEGHGQGGLQARVRGVRTQMLLETMLELRDVGHDHLVSFLAQDGVCERFLSFITQIDEDGDDEDEEDEDEEEGYGGEGGQGNKEASLGRSNRRHRRRRRRLQKGDVLDEEDEIAVSRSFHAMLLLASAEPSEPLLTFLSKKITIITEAMFEVFGPRSRGCFHHACRVIDYVLRFHTEAVLHIIGRSKGSVKRFLGPMVHNLAEAPVAEMLMKLLTVPSPTNPIGQYRAPPSAKWRVFESLAEWRFLLVLADEVSAPHARPEQASAAADVLIDLVERLATDENGELLLQPVGHCPELLNNLLNRALDKEAPPAQRSDCVRVVLALACRSGEAHVPANGYTLAQTQLPYGVTSIPMVPNQFRSVRALFRKNLAAQLPKICECLLAEGQVTTTAAAAATATAAGAAGGGAEGGKGVEGAVAHPGHVVAVPFSYLRLSLVNLLVEILDDSSGSGGGAGQSHHQAQQQQEQARKLLEKVPVPLWRLLCQWFFQYAFSNLYHSLFYRLVHRVLKSNDENVQQTLLSKCRLVSSLVEAYSKGEPSAGNRGHVLNLCNALRLKAGTQSPSTGWLRNFLKSHDTWRRFREPLRQATERAYLQQGLGLLVPSPFAEQVAPDVDMPGLSGFGGGGGGGGRREEGRGGLEMNGLSMFLEGSLEGGGEMGREGGGGAEPRGSIDYGSPLARILGFGEDVEYEEDEAAAGGAANGKRKKKKKKGKKKKGGGGGGLRQLLMDDMHDLEEEEEEEEETEEEEEEVEGNA